MVKKIIKRIFKILGLVLLIAITYVAFWWLTTPQFGGAVSEAQKAEYAKSGHYENGVFLNIVDAEMEVDCHSVQAMLKEMFNPPEDLNPPRNIEVVELSAEEILPTEETKITWFGHSAFLIQMDGKTILLDPMLTPYPVPHPILGRKRYSDTLPLALEEFPHIDVVVISHDHYDHLDHESIQALKAKTDNFVVPLGVGNHLRAWDVDSTKIYELDWWDGVEIDGHTFNCTPSQHMSGRGLGDQSATLWCSWAIAGNEDKIFFSGDGGYGSHFKEIGERFGPFDISLTECGQYNKLWAKIHMMPEESVQAAIDVGAEIYMPIHWGAFSLASHSWMDPIRKSSQFAKEKNINIATPMIGETIILGHILPQSKWWEEYLNSIKSGDKNQEHVAHK